jgi:hypothetical protein
LTFIGFVKVLQENINNNNNYNNNNCKYDNQNINLGKQINHK